MDTIFLEKLCRCCLSEGDQQINLFDAITDVDDNTTLGDNITYSDAIFLCANVRCDVDVIDDNHHIIELPRNICETCRQELRAALKFRIKCESSDTLLREQTLKSTDTTVGNSIEEFVKVDNTNNIIDFIATESKESHLRIEPIEFEHSVSKVQDETSPTKKRLASKRRDHTSYSNVKKHKCEICEKYFANESSLRSHKRTHTGDRPYRCDECDLAFVQGNALKCHKRIHSGEKPYECHICHKRFTQNTILKTHMTLHTGKTIKCPDCDKMFSRASNLILHRREHTGEKPYTCSQCPNSYRQKSHLDRHMDTHLGVKYTCDVCMKSYSKQWSLKVHMFSHSANKPFRCDLCAAEFVRRDKYRNHLKSAHNLPIESQPLNVRQNIK